jgi:uncharacterized protein
MYILPQEVEVWYIIPTIRKELAKAFRKEHNMKYEEIAKILGVSKAAISYYLNSQRGNSIRFSPKLKKEIQSSSEKIKKENKKIVSEISRILTLAKKEKILCRACKKYNKGILNICGMNPSKE